MSDHDIDVLLRAATAGSAIEIPSGWGQGRAAFGGLVGGVLAARAIAEIGADPSTLRSVTVNFVAPANDGAAELTVEVLRQGRSAIQVEARLLQSDGDAVPTVRALALLTFGTQRESSIEIAPKPCAVLPSPTSVEPFPFIKGMTPDFIAHVDLRQTAGSGPYTGADNSDLQGYMRFREPTSDFTLPHLLALIDAWPPAAVQAAKSLIPLSSMTWTVEFLKEIHGDGETFWGYDVITDAAHDGYAHSQAVIQGPDGAPVAISRQTIAMFG